MRVLITGYGGFAGHHLADHLLSTTDWSLWGTVYRLEAPTWVHDDVRDLSVDLRDPAEVRDVVAEVRPDLVFHLAAQAFVPQAWRDPWSTFETNVRMELNLLEALARAAGDGAGPRVVVITSNEVYGAVSPEDLPTDESAPLAPVNPYATSKTAQDLLAAQYARSHGLDTVRVRPFNHTGPGQEDRFVVSSFACQVAEIEAGQRPPVLRVGDLSAARDFSDVRDIVRGYRLAAERGRAGEVYNLGSGRATVVREVLDFFLSQARVPIEVETDPERMRPADVLITQCDAARAGRELGWAPQYTFEETMADVLADWRARVTNGALDTTGDA